MLFLLLVAGHETTVNLLGSGLLALLQHPEQHERLRADRGLMGSAVEEMLRYCSPVETSTARFTLVPTEICGQVIPAEEMVIAGLMSANHDPEVFAEPERHVGTAIPLASEVRSLDETRAVWTDVYGKPPRKSSRRRSRRKPAAKKDAPAAEAEAPKPAEPQPAADAS